MDEKKPQPDTVGKNGKVIHTYASDMAEAIRENEMSVIKIALAEQAKHENEATYLKAEGTKFQKVIWVGGGIFLIALGLVGSYFVFQTKKKAQTIPATPTTQQNVSTIISYDSHAFIDATGATTNADMVSLLTPEIVKPQDSGTIKSIFLTKQTANGQQLLGMSDLIAKLQLTAPASLTRTLSDTYMVGTYEPTDTGATPHLFLILQTNDYGQAYAGMLAWEKTLFSDFFALFSVDVSGSRQDLFGMPFKDVIIENKDARILYDDANKEVLYYIFIDQNTLMITDSQDAIKEVIARLITKNTKPL
jgi:hypothetical protein